MGQFNYFCSLALGHAFPKRIRLDWPAVRAFVETMRQFRQAGQLSLPATAFRRLREAAAPALPDAQTFTTADTCRLAFRHYGPRNGGQPVILVHGSGGFGDQFQNLASSLAAEGFQAYTIDLRGHGGSEGMPGHAVTHTNQLAHDVAQFIEFVDKISGARPILGGHSAGGGLLLRIARSNAGGLVAGYILLAPFLGFGTRINRPFFGGWVQVRPYTFKCLVLANACGITCFNMVTVVTFDVSAPFPDQRYTAEWSFAMAMAFGPGAWSPRPIPSLPPMLALVGENDECFVSSAYPAAFAQIAPNASLQILPDCGHWDLLVDPRTVACVRAFSA